MTKELARAAILLLVLAGAAWTHVSARKRQGLSWKLYGRRLLLGRERQGNVPQYDFLRAVTTILVLLYHSAAMANGALAATAPVTGWLLSAIIILSYSCNMLFVALSGALILPWREESAGRFFVRRFSRIVIPFVLYYLFYLRRTGGLTLSSASILSGLRTIVAGPDSWTPHFWLIYTILGLYLAVPFLRYTLKNMPKRALTGTGLLILAGFSAKTLFAFLGIAPGADSFLFGWTGVFLAGYLAVQPVSGQTERRIRQAGAVSAVILVFLSRFRPDLRSLLAFQSPFMLLLVCALLRAVRRRTRRNGILVRLVSRYSYSILLIHWYIMFIWGEGTLGLTPFIWGEEMILAGIAAQVAVSLGLSLVFALVFDQTVVIAVQAVWDRLWERSRFDVLS